MEERGLWQCHKARIFPSLWLPYTLGTTGAIRRDSFGFLQPWSCVICGVLCKLTVLKREKIKSCS